MHVFIHLYIYNIYIYNIIYICIYIIHIYIYCACSPQAAGEEDVDDAPRSEALAHGSPHALMPTQGNKPAGAEKLSTLPPLQLHAVDPGEGKRKEAPVSSTPVSACQETGVSGVWNKMCIANEFPAAAYGNEETGEAACAVGPLNGRSLLQSLLQQNLDHQGDEARAEKGASLQRARTKAPMGGNRMSSVSLDAMATRVQHLEHVLQQAQAARELPEEHALELSRAKAATAANLTLAKAPQSVTPPPPPRACHPSPH